MKISVSQLDPERIETQRRLFPDVIEEDWKLDVVSCASGERQHVGLWSERLQEP